MGQDLVSVYASTDVLLPIRVYTVDMFLLITVFIQVSCVYIQMCVSVFLFASVGSFGAKKTSPYKLGRCGWFFFYGHNYFFFLNNDTNKYCVKQPRIHRSVESRRSDRMWSKTTARTATSLNRIDETNDSWTSQHDDCVAKSHQSLFITNQYCSPSVHV